MADHLSILSDVIANTFGDDMADRMINSLDAEAGSLSKFIKQVAGKLAPPCREYLVAKIIENLQEPQS